MPKLGTLRGFGRRLLRSAIGVERQVLADMVEQDVLRSLRIHQERRQRRAEAPAPHPPGGGTASPRRCVARAVPLQLLPLGSHAQVAAPPLHLAADYLERYRVYSDGDFLLHLAGLDDKKKWVFDMLDEMRPV
ncbi:hypothetical protein B296_00058601 [Ensete ventricosum]|uniref:Uncharacterized protein n=1 Tax=Ensete ventricosum TaxID=4639 RepID=A0A426WYQ7_ENSVE|nr:hypothetical protein B296_00058601 [Ensete ventricosum]